MSVNLVEYKFNSSQFVLTFENFIYIENTFLSEYNFCY